MTERQILKESILDIVKGNTPKAIPQHLLIAGNEGAGKSFLIDDLARELTSQSYEVTSFFYPHSYIVAAADIINRLDFSSSKHHVILIDDFDRMLPLLPDGEQYGFRSILFKKNAPMLIATSTGIYKGFSDYRTPFYDAFRVFHIPQLEDEDLVQILSEDVYESVKSNQDFQNLLPAMEDNLNYICSLAVAVHSGHSIDEALIKVINENSRYFRHLFNSLSGVLQRALYGLAVANENPGSPDFNYRMANAAQVVRASRLTAMNTSSALFRLEKQGIICKVGDKKRNISYMIKDYLFELWLRKNDK